LPVDLQDVRSRAQLPGIAVPRRELRADRDHQVSARVVARQLRGRIGAAEISLADPVLLEERVTRRPRGILSPCPYPGLPVT
jgi:hypothetical protein